MTANSAKCIARLDSSRCDTPTYLADEPCYPVCIGQMWYASQSLSLMPQSSVSGSCLRHCHPLPESGEIGDLSVPSTNYNRLSTSSASRIADSMLESLVLETPLSDQLGRPHEMYLALCG